MGLVEFLGARLDEDEAVARAVLERRGQRWAYREGDYSSVFSNYEADHYYEDSEFVDRNDPIRVLADVEAKRRIIETVSDEDDAYLWVAKMLALPYASHPDYREEWRP